MYGNSMLEKNFMLKLENYKAMIYRSPKTDPLKGFSKVIPVFDIPVYIPEVIFRYVKTHSKMKDY